MRRNETNRTFLVVILNFRKKFETNSGKEGQILHINKPNIRDF